jgi:two-component sensor histidine kinase
VEEQSVGVERAIPLGLVLNELVSNAYRHGYEPSAARGEIVVRFGRVSNSLVRLEVSDDGRGLPADFLPAKGGALGLQLVQTLAAQLSADLTWNAGHRGACFALTFDARTTAERQISGS